MPALAVIGGLVTLYVVDKTMDYPPVKVWIAKKTRWITEKTDAWKAENEHMDNERKKYREARKKEKAREVINGGDPTSSPSPDGGTA